MERIKLNHFVNKPDDDYICPICLEILRKPVLTTCGHLFCKKCLNSHFNSSSKKCPIDREDLNNYILFLDKRTERNIFSLDIHCPNKNECNWIGNMHQLKKHINTCLFEVLACFNNCHEENIQRKYMENHLKTKCPLQLISCEFKHLGCNVNILRKDIENHMKSETVEHLNLLVNENMKLRKDMNILSKIHDHKIIYNWIINNIDDKMLQIDKEYNVYLLFKGYKFNISYYPGGHKSGKNTHLSIYICVVKNYNDDELFFPVNIKYNFILINQEEISKYVKNNRLVIHLEMEVNNYWLY